MIARRALLVALGLLALFAVLAGLARLGFAVAAPNPMDHGPLLVLGVFAGVISLERAVAFGQPWGYLAPALGALGGFAQLLGWRAAGALLAVAAAAALTGVNAAIVKRQAAPFTWLMLLGSAVLAVGAGAWARGQPIFTVIPAWLAFFALTILAERLELSRLVRTPRWASQLVVALCVAAAVAATLAIVWPEPAVRIFGAALALVALWQLRFDLARRTVRQAGLPRYAAAGVLLGAAWLLLSGVALAALGLPPAGATYDAILHGVFVGFVLSMVFAHAPIILPAVARVNVPYHPVLYLPLGVLHAGLLARVAADLGGWAALRQAGGLANALALALFAVSVLVARARRPS